MWELLVDRFKDRTEFIALKWGRKYTKPHDVGVATVLQGQCSPEVMKEANEVLSSWRGVVCRNGCNVFLASSSAVTEAEWRAAFVDHTFKTRLASFRMTPRVAAALGFNSATCTCLSSSE